MASRFVRKVPTASGAVAVQVVTKDRGVVVDVDHVGSAHTDAELALLLEAARERLSSGQEELDLGELAVVPARTTDVADWTSKQLHVPTKAGAARPLSPVVGRSRGPRRCCCGTCWRRRTGSTVSTMWWAIPRSGRWCWPG